MLNPDDEVLHPQWGKGTVLFDKPHCIGIRFIHHGQVNFSQEEWAAQESPARRFRNITELEYHLEEAVNAGDISPEEAERMYTQRVHPLEVKKRRYPSLNDAYKTFRQHPEDKTAEDDFYTILLKYITAMVKRASSNPAMFNNLEDTIQETAIEVWKNLSRYNPDLSSFSSWVGLIVYRNMRDAMRRFRTAHIPFDEVNTASEALPTDMKLFLKTFLESLSGTDREILEMLSHDYSLREIGKELGLSHEGIRKHLSNLRLTKR